jgi:hypothetical protein
MTDMTTTHRPESDESHEVLVTSQPTSTGTHALITEQQVLFSTTAAVALPPAKAHGWSDAVHTVTAALRALFAESEKSAAPKHYPKRHAWLDNAVMSREMDRL